MQSEIVHKPTGIILDLSKPGLGHPDGLAIIEAHYHDCHRDKPPFECVKHLGGTNPGMYLKKIRGAWWAVHFEVGPCESRRIPTPMSDEHKRQAEYWVRAAEDAGWRVETEHSLPTGTRPDVLIHGSVTTGVEVQRSPMTAAAAVARTHKAAAAGVTNLWFTVGTLPPPWAWHVPTVLNRELGIPGEGHSWESTPPRRAATAAGLRTIHAARCTQANFSRCPYGRKRHCGKLHPQPRVWRSLKVDDVAAQAPGGGIVALRFWGTRQLGGRHREATFLVPVADRALYEELTASTGSALISSPTSGGREWGWVGGRVECRNPQTSSRGESGPFDPAVWDNCTGCQRRYRPSHPSGRCHVCRFPGELPAPN